MNCDAEARGMGANKQRCVVERIVVTRELYANVVGITCMEVNDELQSERVNNAQNSSVCHITHS